MKDNISKMPESRSSRLARMEQKILDLIESEIDAGKLKPTALALLAKLIFDKNKESIAPEQTTLNIGFSSKGEEKTA